MKFRVILLSLLVLLAGVPLFAQDEIDCDAPLEIWQVQGSGAEANCLRKRIVLNENIVTAVGDAGFFMQTPAARVDGDPATSDGLYVATSFPPSSWGVELGALVNIDGGRVAEQFEMTQIDLSAQRQLTVLSTGNPLPEPIDLRGLDYTVTPGGLHPMEPYEGMLVMIMDAVVVAPTNQYDEFGVTASDQRVFREPGIEPDRTPQFVGLGLPEWDLNPELFEVDPPEMGLPSVPLTPGAQVSVVGGLAYSFQDYQIWPQTLEVTPVEFVPRPVRAREAGEFSIATQNVENLFDLLDDPDRDDATFEDYVPDDQAAYDLRLGKTSAQIREQLGAPDIVALQEIESINVGYDLITRIEADDPTLTYEGCLIEGNDGRGIDNAYLVRVDTVAIIDCYQMPGSLEAIQSGNNRLYGRPPLVLEAELLAEAGAFPITLINVHIKSLGGIETRDTQERRLMQAEGIAAYVQALQDEGRHVVVLGDFNGFEFTDGIVDVVNIIAGSHDPTQAMLAPEADLVEPNLVNQVLKVPADDRYSYMFNGSYQVLDHLLTSQTLDALVTDVQFSRGNADALELWFEEGPSALRSSDHDGLVLFIRPG